MANQIRFLLLTVILLPVAAWFLGTPPVPEQVDLIRSCAWIVAGVILYCFVVGQLTGNNSQVDKLWSIVPIAYAWYMTAEGGWHPRMILMAVLVTLWGVRLTYNFARRGAYQWKFWTGEEDYRWAILRQKPGLNKPWVWLLFNLFFICIYQNILIFLFGLPILASLQAGANPLSIWDVLLAFAFLFFLVIEFIADQQQYEFQTEKYRRIRAGEALGPYADGFVKTGLWSRMRHPNYMAEQAIWIVYYLFSVVATGEWLNWTISGAALLLLLFRGSSDFSESISAEKYPAYKEYQKSVSRFLPF